MKRGRKSSNNTFTENGKKIWKCGKYKRLSKEDGHDVSYSIENQDAILEYYLANHPEIQVVDNYQDDGRTGTDSDREDFQRLLADIYAKKINCVIVKDLSRLSRNDYECGHYLEYVFVSLDVRFISVELPALDSYLRPEEISSIATKMQSYMNDQHCYQTSIKIRSVLDMKRSMGQFIGAFAPYGYLKAPDDCHQLIIDPVAAPVVQKMFQWASEGIGLNTITVRLNEVGYLPPSHYKNTQSIITHENLMGNGNWNTRTVARILHAQVYTGDLVQGRTKIVDHQQVEVSEMEWTVVHGTHEAIISQELFEAVQKKLDETAQHCKEREVQAYSPNILKGKIFCAHCGGSLHRHRNFRKKSADVYLFYCLTNSRIAKERCPGVLIREDVLLDSLADMLQNALDAALGSYSLSLLELPQQAAERAELNEKITCRKQEIQRLRGLIRSLYENLIQDILTKDEYITYKGKYESKIEQLSEEVSHLEKGLKALDKQMEQHQALKRDSDDLRENRELTAALIDRLIDRVEVSKDKQITVRYRFENEFDSCEEVLNQCKNM